MDPSQTPLLDAADYYAADWHGFTPPGPRQTHRVLDALDHRRVSNKCLKRAEDLMVEALGRIAVEQITPYPLGIPTVMPGERLTATVIEYPRTGRAGRGHEPPGLGRLVAVDVSCCRAVSSALPRP